MFESTLSSVFHIRPYRCLRCDYRHFRLRPASGHMHDHPLPPNSRCGWDPLGTAQTQYYVLKWLPVYPLVACTFLTMLEVC